MRRQQYAAATRPVYDATNHYSKQPNIYQRAVRKGTVIRTYRIAAVRSWNKIGIKKECDEFDDRIKIEEHDNLLATYTEPKTVVDTKL
jgi:hypothetical protein